MLQKFLKLFELGYPSFWKKNNNLINKIFIIFLLPLSLLYFLISKIYKKIIKEKRVGVPVICIGNLNVGGSGKTPFVIFLANLLNKKKIKTHVVTRGYLGKYKGPVRVDPKKHSSKDVGDEALLIAKKNPTWVSKNKFEGALMATLHGADVIILDDGLQNYSLYQNLKIIVVDGEFGFGNKLLLPAGPLRETISSGLKKSDLLIIFNNDKTKIKEKVKKKIPIVGIKSKTKLNYKIKKSKIVAFSGIGRPEKFLESLKESNLNVKKFFPFPDHYRYSKREINDLIKYANENNSILVSTKKDEQRINWDQRKKINFLDLEIVIKNKDSLINFFKKKKIV